MAWMLLPANCHDAFRNADRAARQLAADTDNRARARGSALTLSVVFLPTRLTTRCHEDKAPHHQRRTLAHCSRIADATKMSGWQPRRTRWHFPFMPNRPD
jgi:hypothetical protein